MKFLSALLVLGCLFGLCLSEYTESVNAGDGPTSDELDVKEKSTEEKSNHLQVQEKISDTIIEEKDQTKEENTENGIAQQKRYGFVLGKGFNFGKRFGVLGHGMSFGKRFGSILGKGKSFGKRFGSVLGRGMSFGKRYGALLGKGFAFGKRDPELYENDNINAYRNIIPDVYTAKTSKRDMGEDIDEDMELVDLSGPVDEKKWILNDIYSGGFPEYKRSKRDTRTELLKPYYGNVLGRGFSIGKKDDVPETNAMIGKFGVQASGADLDNGGADVENRFISGLNGQGFISSKRKSSYGRTQKQSYGNVLGRGFSFGKRDGEMEENPPNANTNHAFSAKMNAIEQLQQKRYFHSSPGHRFLFGKRDMGDSDKRFGFLLGNGYSFGKRGEIIPQKRPYGYLLGRGFSFGKRSSDFDDEKAYANDPYTFQNSENGPYLDKRAGFVLGKGYMFGKRSDKRFGWVLGNGFTFGKRDGNEQSYEEPEVSQFIDEFGNIFIRTDFIEHFNELNSDFLEKNEQRVYACAGNLIPHSTGSQNDLEKLNQDDIGQDDLKKRSAQHEMNYFIDGMGNMYVNADDIAAEGYPLIREDNEDLAYYTCDGPITELIGDDDIYNEVSKRGWGSVLGRGFRFGKRFGSKKRFGHILGGGFSWGK